MGGISLAHPGPPGSCEPLSSAPALFANAVPYLLFALAEQHVGSSAAGLIVGFAGAVLIFTSWPAGSGLVPAGGLECLARPDPTSAASSQRRAPGRIDSGSSPFFPAWLPG
jgi:hypothetical protein